jgi:anti-sigma regulatory factor (Ser/Thr protein kinase)
MPNGLAAAVQNRSVEDVESPGRRMTETFPDAPEFVSRARHDVEAFLRGADVSEDVMQTAALLASELVTNAVLHAHSPFTLTAELGAQRLRVEVEDASTQLPEVLRPTPSSAAGRGMFMVEALSSRWGAEPMPGGKRVWFELVLF